MPPDAGRQRGKTNAAVEPGRRPLDAGTWDGRTHTRGPRKADGEKRPRSADPHLLTFADSFLLLSPYATLLFIRELIYGASQNALRFASF